MYNSIDTSATALTTFRTWVDALANNIANVNTVRRTDEDAFQAQYVQVSSIEPGADGIGRGVESTAVPEGDPAGQLSYDPGNPLADAEGMVRRPDIDMSEQMGNLIIAQRAFQANASMVDRAKDIYQAAIAIGKGM